MKVVATIGLWINQPKDEDGKEVQPLIFHKGNEYDISEELYQEESNAFRVIATEPATENIDVEAQEAISELKTVRAGYGLKSYTRSDLDEMAASIGIKDPSELPNKDAVADAIIAQSEDE